MPLDDDLPTTPQNEWTVIADTLRGHVDRLSKSTLKPDELVYVLNGALLAIRLDVQARAFDADEERAKSRFDCNH